ncbi:murein hydrolase activator EnvC [Novosphingobium sp. Gsoil 351]|uniref:murein hydrolase activator EnvC family protein n=1 Tax=Novosphingobium sp. Gsoil 351 TaxID=2675225 RepID=UPI0012B47A34|nr:peptidoglycan DD-metalloendopeptidase family protein [Novosphingobium sp. Gsoil 351]QGN54930.1 peptidoglycan DD-metalloendopeptidase family protein [Novosphingobium sp. Gsoil 351]
MTSRSTPVSAPICAIVALALAVAAGVGQAQAPVLNAGDDPRGALAAALTEQRFAAARAGRLETAAAQASAAADRTAQATAALAARIQQAEAGVAAGEARIALIERQRASLRDSLAVRQAPLVRLTAALQLMSRRPLGLSVVRPGSLRDMVHLRAVLESMLPAVRRQTAGLRAGILRARQLQAAVRQAQSGLRGDQARLAERRAALVGIETRQRLSSRAARGDANREADRALALAEEARDLTSLMGTLEQAGALRQRLAALPGPMLRPAQPGAARIEVSPVASPTAGLDYILPLAGTIVTGFGEASSGGGSRSRGITIAARSGAQVIAPAAGRVAFAGRYKGFGQIAIIEHDGGWTTLITDLAAVAPAVGDRVVQGAPLGVAGPGSPRVTIELRKNGAPVDVLAAISRR